MKMRSCFVWLALADGCESFELDRRAISRHRAWPIELPPTARRAVSGSDRSREVSCAQGPGALHSWDAHRNKRGECLLTIRAVHSAGTTSVSPLRTM